MSPVHSFIALLSELHEISSSDIPIARCLIDEFDLQTTYEIGDRVYVPISTLASDVGLSVKQINSARSYLDKLNKAGKIDSAWVRALTLNRSQFKSQYKQPIEGNSRTFFSVYEAVLILWYALDDSRTDLQKILEALKQELRPVEVTEEVTEPVTETVIEGEFDLSILGVQIRVENIKLFVRRSL